MRVNTRRSRKIVFVYNCRCDAFACKCKSCGPDRNREKESTVRWFLEAIDTIRFRSALLAYVCSQLVFLERTPFVFRNACKVCAATLCRRVLSSRSLFALEQGRFFAPLELSTFLSGEEFCSQLVFLERVPLVFRNDSRRAELSRFEE